MWIWTATAKKTEEENETESKKRKASEDPIPEKEDLELANLNKKLDALVSELRKELLERTRPLESEQQEINEKSYKLKSAHENETQPVSLQMKESIFTEEAQAVKFAKIDEGTQLKYDEDQGQNIEANDANISNDSEILDSNNDLEHEKENEAEEILRLQQNHYRKLNGEIVVEYEKLERERSANIRELKRIQVEDQSKWNDFPVLDDRYPLLMLVGKSGFYEEHKGFDLKAHKYVACKLPQLNSDWADNKKANYIKHALREYNIHKSLHHPRIVRLQDVFEISSNSFCTVLEFWNVHGPDFLLKQNKILKVVRKNIVKMCTELAEEIAEDKVKYKKFYEQFGKSMKLGIREDSANRKKLSGYIRHDASATGDEQSSLDIYVPRMIKMSTYYITSRSKDKVGEASGPSRGLRAFNAHWHKDKLPHEARQMAGIQYQLGVALTYPGQLDEVVKHTNDMDRLEATDVGFFNSKSDMHDEYIVASNEMRGTFKFMHICAPYDQFDPGGTSRYINPTGIGGRVEEVLGTINGAGQLGTVLQFSGRIAVGLVPNN